jgi:hypothetical protein
MSTASVKMGLKASINKFMTAIDTNTELEVRKATHTQYNEWKRMGYN